jgi:hypothetical protein
VSAAGARTRASSSCTRISARSVEFADMRSSCGLLRTVAGLGFYLSVSRDKRKVPPIRPSTSTIARMADELRNESSIGPMPKPQNGPNSDSPGAYDLVFRRPRTEVAPGEEAEIEIYITGYGSISNVKFFFMPPASFVESDSCSVEHSLNVKEDGRAHFGSVSVSGGENGFTVDLSSGGLQQPGWPGPSLFFDTGIGIATERGTPEPPVKVRFKINKDAANGDHSLSFALTYFNGREWCVAYRTAVLHVPTLYERYEGRAWIIGAIIALVAMIAAIIAAAASIVAIKSSSGAIPNTRPSYHVESCLSVESGCNDGRNYSHSYRI